MSHAIEPQSPGGATSKIAELSSESLKIAVIGGGIAGLSAGWMLGGRHRVTLYERLPEPGMGAHGIEAPARSSVSRIDVPIRTFYDGYYPHLSALYRHIGVATEAVNLASTYASLDGEVFLRYRNFKCRGLSLPWVANPWGSTTRRIIKDLFRFRRDTRHALGNGRLQDISLGQYLEEENYGAELVDLMLLPLFAVICTCSYADVLRFPASIFAEYFQRGVFSQAMRRPAEGTSAVVSKLSRPLAEIRLGVGVTELLARPEGLEVRDDAGQRETFDHVVMATQANQASELIAAIDPEAAEILRAFRYDWIRVLTHTDSALLPPDRRHWSPINAAISRAHDRPMATIWLDAVQPSLGLSRPVFQTVHPLIEPDPEEILGSATFERPLVDAASDRALKRLEALHSQPDRRLWLCGSYAARGIPLLESAVASAAVVAQRLGGRSYD